MLGGEKKNPYSSGKEKEKREEQITIRKMRWGNVLHSGNGKSGKGSKDRTFSAAREAGHPMGCRGATQFLYGRGGFSKKRVGSNRYRP